MNLEQVIIGLGVIIGLFLIYKLFTVQHLYKKWAVYNKVRIVFLIIAIFFGTIVALTYSTGSNLGLSRGEVLEIIKKADLHKTNRIEFFSCSGLNLDSTDEAILISDRALISQISYELKELNFIEHSSSSIMSWGVKMRIVLEDNSLNNIVFDISKMENGDCFFWIMKHTWFGDFNLGLCKDNEFGGIVEAILLSPPSVSDL